MTGSRERFLAELEATEVVKSWKLPLKRKPAAPKPSWTKPVSRADAMADRSYRELREQAATHPQRRGVGKRDTRPQRPPLPKTLSTKESGLLVARHGLTGTLPSHLNREERMKVYEARYHAAGGRKGEKYARRAQASDRVKVGALGTATAAGAGILAARTRKGAKLLGGLHHAEKIKSHAETTGIAAATVGGAAELYGDAARRKQASYTSTPAGVAASALRRLHAYPGGPK